MPLQKDSVFCVCICACVFVFVYVYIYVYVCVCYLCVSCPVNMCVCSQRKEMEVILSLESGAIGSELPDPHLGARN